jgi:2-polyprenyl-3-methyl-5-hydroxy-6-metoxy-1,4-benzoquinol methylase
MEPTTILFLIVFGLLLLHYLVHVWISRNKVVPWNLKGTKGGVEGFEDTNATMATNSEVKWLEPPELFDDFYSKVYDQLAQGSNRLQAELGLALHAFSAGPGGKKITDMRILDAGCGTGIVTAAIAKMNAAKVIAVDMSPAMLHRAKTVTLEESTLTQAQKDTIEYRQSDLLNPSALAPGEVTNAIVFYFVTYYIHDIETLFRNLFVWVSPGGMIAVEVVNKYKFDPMLDSSAPWMGFSLQKYSKERVTQSKVTFDKFEYEGKFDLIDPVAEFRETFRFKDGSVRRQKHVFVMPAIEEIVKTAKVVGWEYKSYVDLTTIGFEYAYLLIFKHP